MKKLSGIIAMTLLICMMITGCSNSNTPSDGTSAQTTTQSTPDTTEAPTTTSTSIVETTAVDTTTAADTTAIPDTPPTEIKQLPQPYVDIEFGENGSIFDACDHVTCNIENTKSANVVTENVPIDGKEYTFPHLYIKSQGGFARLTYKDITEKSQLMDLLSNGITLEAMVLNYNKFTSSSGEQAIAGTCQSGGYNLSCYKGAYTFSVHTGGAYRSAHNPSGVINDSMTHLIGIYDPESRTSTLYVNGQMAARVAASGTLALATGDLWKQIILGGDIGNNFVPHILSNNVRIADYKIYPAAMSEGEVEIAYEQMKVKFMGEAVDYTLSYYEGDRVEEDMGDRLFSTYAASYVNVYEPKTALVNSPTILTYADSNNYSTLAKAESRPATLIFTVKTTDNTLHAYDKNGKDLGTLEDAVRALDTKIIPAFIIEDSNTASLLTEFINYNRIGDCFVISSNGELLNKTCKATRSARPVLDMSASTTADVKQIRLAVSGCQAKIVLLNETAVTAEEVGLLRASSHTVFLKTANGTEGIHNAIFKGTMGIIADDYTEAISYMETFTVKTLSNPTYLVAHRGDMQNCPQNILRSFISAAQSGAPIIELDVYMTTDKHLAINHDATTTHWDKQLTCTESTREQLKALKNTESTATADDSFTFLDEVFEYFSANYTDMIIHVEIKDKRNAVVDKVVELAKQYGMLDRILIICSNHEIVRYASDTYQISTQMIRSYIYNRNDVLASLAYACEEVVPLNSAYYTVWADSFDALNTALRHRGIKYCTWTTTSASATDSDYARGYLEFTSNTPHRCDSYVRYLKAEIDANGNVKVTRVNYDGSTTDVTKDAKLIVISGNVTFTNGKISGSGTFAFSYASSVASYKYEVCSLSITK